MAASCWGLGKMLPVFVPKSYNLRQTLACDVWLVWQHISLWRSLHAIYACLLYVSLPLHVHDSVLFVALATTVWASLELRPGLLPVAFVITACSADQTSCTRFLHGMHSRLHSGRRNINKLTSGTFTPSRILCLNASVSFVCAPVSIRSYTLLRSCFACTLPGKHFHASLYACTTPCMHMHSHVLHRTLLHVLPCMHLDVLPCMHLTSASVPGMLRHATASRMPECNGHLTGTHQPPCIRQPASLASIHQHTQHIPWRYSKNAKYIRNHSFDKVLALTVRWLRG